MESRSMRHRWLEASVEADLETADAVAELFARYGYQQGVAVFHAVNQEPDSEEATIHPTAPVLVTTYLPIDEQIDETIAKLRQGLWYLSQLAAIGELHLRPIAEEDWTEAWKQHFPITRIGQRLVIRPPWLPYVPQAHDVVIELDPGMAFGTGLHPTTQHCLLWLEELVEPAMQVLDAGAGSGILSIAALKLGADRVTALEIDPVAVEVLQHNLARNGVRSRAVICAGDITQILQDREKYDLVVANIIARVLIAAGPALVRAARPEAWIILSGIITTVEREVRARFHQLGASVVSRRQDGDWVSLLCRRIRS